MALTHNLGFPRIGARRELKFALEKHWKGILPQSDLEAVGAALRELSWQRQAQLDLVPAGDFSLYDHVLDTSFLVGNVPARARAGEGEPLDAYFRVARGRASNEPGAGIAAGEMTKWFDTNYHYIVPELSAGVQFRLDATRLLSQLREVQSLVPWNRDSLDISARPRRRSLRCAPRKETHPSFVAPPASDVEPVPIYPRNLCSRGLGLTAKPVIVGPVTYLHLAKAKDGSDKLACLPRLLPVYRELLATLAASGVEWVQLDEPVLVTELDATWRTALRTAYEALAGAGPKLLLASYFGRLGENLALAASLPVDGVHLDAVNAPHERDGLLAALPERSVLSLGVVNGRNVWRTDLHACLDSLEPIHQQLGDRLWIAPSCSLLHVPVDAANETKLDPELSSWLSFAQQKLEEVRVLGLALNRGRAAIRDALAESAKATESRRTSRRVHDPRVQAAVAASSAILGTRQAPYSARAVVQASAFALPKFPTTTIGSFPQTPQIRKARKDFRAGTLDEAAYRAAMRDEIARTVREQEKLGLDVLVHGEAERNDMVEYFGEQLEGYAFSELGWVQSYGSRCVKPPILFGDVSRPKPMTVDWIRYAQSLTSRPVKGMLTGPVTILNWSFVRDDQPRAASCHQLALAMREEVLDLERAGVRMIQIDEAALREGLPLRRSDWPSYLGWAVDAFRITSNGVQDATQIHTHMCYSDFNDILDSIAAMDADVITIETSRSDMELLDAFEHFAYPNEIGPGVYDIHAPNVPTEQQIMALMRKAAERIPADRLWVNPDCGLKTRSWAEVLPALQHLVSAARRLRAELG